MFEQVKEVIQKYTEAEIKEQSSLVDDLGLSSFDLVAIVADFEDVFGMEVPDKDIMSFLTVADIVAYIEKNVKA